jgi:aldose 1-epimerase
LTVQKLIDLTHNITAVSWCVAVEVYWRGCSSAKNPVANVPQVCNKRGEGTEKEMTMSLAKVILLTMTTAMAAHGSVTKAAFGNTSDGTAVDIYTLKAEGIEAQVTTYGARVVSIKTPDRDGKVSNVVLGYSALDGYLEDKSYLGAIVGRYGNRIAFGKFSIDGQEHQVTINDGPNSLHGGKVGFDQLVWKAREIADGVEMTLVSKDGDQGYPGTLTAHVRYTVHHGALRIDYNMSTDKPTVVNLTNHSYFNLSGDSKKTILNDVLTLPADKFTPVDSGLIPTGELAPVEGTPFDFRKATAIGSRINEDNQQLKYGLGYDLNWVLRGENGVVKTAAQVYDPVSGRVMTVTTTEPGVQFYSGNHLTGAKAGKAQEGFEKNTALCLETQHFPDSPNHPSFPSTVLRPGEARHSTTTFTFTTHAK